MTECCWIMRIMIMLTDKGFVKAEQPFSLTFYLQPDNHTCLCSHSFYSISWIHHVTIFHPWQYLFANTETWYCSPWHLFESCLCGPRALWERCQALIGEPVIFCCLTIDFYLHSYLLMDTKPVADYWSSLQKQHWKETEQGEEWGINLFKSDQCYSTLSEAYTIVFCGYYF